MKKQRYAILKTHFIIMAAIGSSVEFLNASIILPGKNDVGLAKYSFPTSLMEKLDKLTRVDMEISNLELVNYFSARGFSVFPSGYITFPPQPQGTKITHVWYLGIPDDRDIDHEIGALKLTKIT